jgi:hypothetical protein
MDLTTTDASDAICAVSGAQYLTKTGWSGLRNDQDGDVPFGFFRDEGKIYLKVCIRILVIVSFLSQFERSGEEQNPRDRRLPEELFW